MKRSRVALAVAITLAALPILVLDNLPATAEADENQVEALASDSSEAPPPTTATTAPPSTTTTVAPTTTAAPTTTEAPTTTAAEVAELQAASAPAPTTTVAPPPPPPPAPSTTAPPANPGSASDPATWDRLARCEAGGNWAMNSGNGYYGGLQFSLATWKNVGGVGYPHQASKAEQIKRGQILQARAGWGQWPHCARQLGLL